VGLGYRAPRWYNKLDVLSVCLSVTLLNDKVCERHFAINALEYGNDLGIVGQRDVRRTTFNFVSITLDGAKAERKMFLNSNI